MKFKANIEVIVEADSAWAAGDALIGIFLEHEPSDELKRLLKRRLAIKSPTPSLIDWAYSSGDIRWGAGLRWRGADWVETDDGGE